MVIKNKIFTMQDQKMFSKISGDFNPIHVDEKFAIKTHAGQPIVHGVHLVLYLLNDFNISIKPNTKINVKFFFQVSLDINIKSTFDESKKEITVMSESQELLCKMKITTSLNNSLTNKKIIFNTTSNKPEKPNINEIIVNQKITNLYGGKKSNLTSWAFPKLVNKIGENIVYEIACISSLVGMKVPGKHSLFAGLSLTFNGNPDNYLIIKNKHELYKLLSMEYFGLNVSASIQAFFRPEPAKVLSIENLSLKFNQIRSIKNKKTLVIGGSRGIGAYVTKICAMMGSKVTFTYNSQKEDAILIKKDIISNNRKVKFLKLNVLNKNEVNLLDKDFDYVYYFPTPKISSNKNKKINKKLMDFYYLFYIEAFEDVIKTLSSKNKNTKFLYPSSTYLNENKDGFREYIKIKLMGENLCELYKRNHSLNIIYPRIPQLNTDQNLSLSSFENNDTSEYAYKLVSLMSKS